MRRRLFRRKPTHLGNKNAQDLNIIFVWRAGSGVGGGGSRGGSKKSVPSSSSLWAQGQVTGGRKEGEEEKRRDEEQREGGRKSRRKQTGSMGIAGVRGTDAEYFNSSLAKHCPTQWTLHSTLWIKKSVSFIPNREMHLLTYLFFTMLVGWLKKYM